LLLRGRDKVRRQRLLDVSKHEPDPLAAITEAEQRQPAK
jgi:hypothetical protein